jgi:HD-GYP domain-containing protein (c-di-GMP phosphodiesterase class II)
VSVVLVETKVEMNRLLAVLRQVEVDFAEEETIPRGLSHILGELIRITRTQAGAIFTQEPPTDVLHLSSIQNLTDEVMLDVFQKHEQEILNAFSLSKKESITFKDRLQGRGWMVRVLRVNRKMTGLVFLQIPEKPLEFDAQQNNALSVLLSICSLMLDNVHQREAARRALIGMAKAFSTSLDTKDQYTHGHSERVTLYALAIASMAEKYIPRYYIPHSEIRLAGLLHDIGKIGIPDSILCKPSKLTPEEYSTIKSHAELGRKMLSTVPDLKIAMDGNLHHERYDGKGYPLGLAGENIPLIGRILSVADTYDAMTSTRPYRASLNPAVALDEIREMSGTQFDPLISKLFEHAYNEGLIHSIIEVHRNGELPEQKTKVSETTALLGVPCPKEEELCRRIFARIDEISFGTPSGPSLIPLLENPDIGLADIAKRIENDITLATRILQLANSSFYCFPRRIRTIEQGLVILGLRETRRIVHLANMMTLFQNSGLSNFDMKLFWKHSLTVGLIAKFLAERFHNRRLAEDAFLTGIVHDIGRLALIKLHQKPYENVVSAVLKNHVSFVEAEIQEFGISHDRASGFLIEKWNLPAFLGQTLGCHHARTDSGENRLLSRIIKAADDLSYRSKMAIIPNYPFLPLEDEAIAILGLKNAVELKNLVTEINGLLDNNQSLFEIGTTDTPSPEKEPELAGVS